MSNVFDRIASNADNNRAPESNQSETNQFSKDTGSNPTSNNRQRSSDVIASRTPSDLRIVILELLRNGYLEESRKPEWFRKAITHATQIDTVLEPLDLAIKLDTFRGIALLVVRPPAEGDENADDEWSHPLVRRQRLTLEQSLLIAILRGAFVLHEQESGVGQRPATMAVDEILPQLITYLGDSGSDSRNETRLNHLLDQLKGYGIVSEVDAKQEFIIRPIIAHIANPESLTALLDTMTRMSSEPMDSDSDEG